MAGRAGHRTLRVAIEILEVEDGLWCRTCALPSGRRVWFTCQTGPALSLREHLCCADGGCGHDIDPTRD